MNYSLPEKKEDLLKLAGCISQFAGAKRYFLADGKGAGVECVDVRLGNGFEYTVMPGRGMDIGWCGYKGAPVSYISKVGVTNPGYFNGMGTDWLKCFPGGLLSTCGLGNVGDSCEDEITGLGKQVFGLHGRVSNQCAKNICVNEYWDQDNLIIEVAGTDVEAQLRGENFSLRRTVIGKLGEKCLRIRDVITNEDFISRPYMVMYHINFGYPIVDDGSIVHIRHERRFEDTQVSIDNAQFAAHLTSPVNSIDENLYFYVTSANEKQGIALIENRKLEAAVYVRYSADTLPYLTEWKMMGESDYVVGLEAGNCIPRGRVYHRDRGILKVLAAQESVVNEIEIGLIEGKEQIASLLEKEAI